MNFKKQCRTLILIQICFEIGIQNEIVIFLVEKECPRPVVKHGEAYSPNKTFEYQSEAHFFCNEG